MDTVQILKLGNSKATSKQAQFPPVQCTCKHQQHQQHPSTCCKHKQQRPPPPRDISGIYYSSSRNQDRSNGSQISSPGPRGFIRHLRRLRKSGGPSDYEFCRLPRPFCAACVCNATRRGASAAVATDAEESGAIAMVGPRAAAWT